MPLRVGERDDDLVAVGVADDEEVHPVGLHHFPEGHLVGFQTGAVGVEIADTEIDSLFADALLLLRVGGLVQAELAPVGSKFGVVRLAAGQVGEAEELEAEDVFEEPRGGLDVADVKDRLDVSGESPMAIRLLRDSPAGALCAWAGRASTGMVRLS